MSNDRIRTGGLDMFIQKVEEFGWVGIPQVGGMVPYMYTMGIQQTTAFPDIVVVGIPQTVRDQQRVSLTNKIAYEYYKLVALAGKQFREGDELWLAGMLLHAKEVKHNTNMWDDWFSAARLFNEYHEIRHPKMIQLFWADRLGKFPWQEGFSRPRNFRVQTDFASYSKEL